jgi:hypothetical protein
VLPKYPVQFVTHVSGQFKGQLAVEAVQCELFPEPNSLLTEKKPGILELPPKPVGDNSTPKSVLARETTSSKLI